LLEVLREGQQKLENESRGLMEALGGVREDTAQQGSVLLKGLQDGQHWGVSRHEALLEALRSGYEETRQHALLLAEMMRQGDASAERRSEGLVGAVRETHQETTGRLRELIGALKETNAAVKAQGTQVFDALGEVQKGAVQQSSVIGGALKDIRIRLEEECQLLQDAVGRVRVESMDPLQGKAILLRNGESVGEPEVDLMAHLYSYLPSRTAVDIGANVGDVSNRLLEAGYEVYAFEPNSTVFYHLNDRLGRHADFHCYPWALGSIDEARQLHIVSDLSGSNVYEDPTLYSSLTLHSMPDDLVFSRSVPVSVRSLESLHASRHVPVSPGLVKIDTEGFDLEVIRGMGPHRYPVVVAEYWDPAIPFGESGAMNRLDDMVKEMKGKGYHWYVVFYRIWGKEGVSFYCNHPRSVDHTYGNVFFFQDHNVFTQALLWCSAVLPATYVGR
jgi:FkbM family methyltransferase